MSSKSKRNRRPNRHPGPPAAAAAGPKQTTTFAAKGETELPVASSIASSTPAAAAVVVVIPPKVEPDLTAMEEASKDPKRTEKSKEEILAEREAKKAAKAATKNKGKPANAATPNSAENQKGSKQEVGNKVGDVKKTLPPPPPKEDQVKEGVEGEASKNKAELKAERRAKQEAQRAAKIAVGEGGGAAAGKVVVPPAPAGDKKKKVEVPKAEPAVASSKGVPKGQRVPDDMQADRACVEKKLSKKLVLAQLPERTKAQRKVMLFSHLHQYEHELSIGRSLPVVGGPIPSCVLQLGLRYAEGTISGSNARCVALLDVMKKVIQDYTNPEDKEISRDLDSRIKPYITFLKQCRTISVSMGNAIRFLKARINSLGRETSVEEAKEMLIGAIDDFVHENIVLAAKQIAITAEKKIRDGDVILTYGCSSLLRTVFTSAASAKDGKPGKRFRVIVADGRPKFEGREMLRHLVNADMDCSYVQVTTVPYIMPEVTKVFLGAHAVLANGSVMSRVGNSQVALIAKAYNVPVLVCCETYKFSERVQTDSFVFNELCDPDDLVSTGRSSYTPLDDWRDLNDLCLLNMNYDVTPASLVDAIISELSVIPTTSVPVVLRLKNLDQQ